LIKEGKVTSESSRAEISRLAKGTTNVAPKWVYVELASGKKTFTSEQLEALTKLLNGSDWVVKSKKSDTDKKSTN
jgi:hypothetical protein